MLVLAAVVPNPQLSLQRNLETRGMEIPSIDQHLLPQEAARVLKRSVRTLARMRAEGRGPKYHREGGRILYPVSGLSEWLARHWVIPNRSRWPNAPLWEAALEQIKGHLFDMNCTVDPDLVKRVQLEAYDDLLAGQLAGLLITKAALHRVSLADFRSFSARTGEELVGRFFADPAKFERKLARRLARLEVQRGTLS